MIQLPICIGQDSYARVTRFYLRKARHSVAIQYAAFPSDNQAQI